MGKKIGASSVFSDLMVKVYKEDLGKLLSIPSEVVMNNEPGDHEKYEAPWWVEEKAAMKAQESLTIQKMEQAMEILKHVGTLGTWELIDVGKAVEYIQKSMEKSAEEKFWGRIAK